jgi:hypothetical protein
LSSFNETGPLLAELDNVCESPDDNCLDSLTRCADKMRRVSVGLQQLTSAFGAGCHELLSDWNPFLDGCKYWLEGVSLCVIGIFGLFGNGLAIVVLGSTKDSNRCADEIRFKPGFRELHNFLN